MTDNGRRTLILGRSGQVSRSLVEVLTASGHDVMTMGRPEADLRDPASLSKAILAAEPEFVINAAAYTAVDRAEDEAEAAFAINAAGARAAAEAANKVDATIIHFSTDYVFDGAKRTPYIESDPVSPLGVYGKSKLAGERLVAEVNPKHVVLRTAWVFSPFGSNFATTMLRLNREQPEINVVNDQFGNPTYAPDLSEVVRQIIDRLCAPSPGTELFGTFHAVNSEEATWHGFARAIIEGAAQRDAPRAAVHPIPTSKYPTKARRPAYSALSTDKLARVYGIRLRQWREALSDGLDRLIGPYHSQTAPQQQQDVDQSA